MPELLIAANPGNSNPVNLAAPSARTEAAGGAQENSGNQEPFAAKLEQQIKGQSKDAQASAKTSKADEAAADVPPQTPTVPSIDAMAALMPMLVAAIPVPVVNVSTSAGERGGDDKATPGVAPMAAIESAAPVTALPVQATLSLSLAPVPQAPDKGVHQEASAGLMAQADAGKQSAEPAIPAAPAIVASALSADQKSALAAVPVNPNPDVPPGGGFQALLEAGRAAQLAQQPVANAPTHSVSATTNSVGTPAWSQEIGDRVVWMATQKESRADLVLNPPQLGRVEISLTVSGDQVTANFISGNSSVRDALENALPRLREILSDAGIQLGQAQVGADNASRWAGQGETRHNAGSSSQTGADSIIASATPANAGSITASGWLRQGNGLVDAFA